MNIHVRMDKGSDILFARESINDALIGGRDIGERDHEIIIDDLSDTAQHDDALDALGEFGNVLRLIHARLKSGGPEVKYEEIFAYIDGDLSREDLQTVRRKIFTWWN